MLSSITAGGLTIANLAICSALSIILGLIIAFVHKRTTKTSKNFAVTLVVLPILVQIVMMMVSGNIGTGIAIMGAFSLVRFRSIPGTSREIVSVFFAMAIGLATGTGFIGFAILATAIISLVLILLTTTNIFGASKETHTLKITLPEDADHDEALSPVFTDHKVTQTLKQVKTKNMGSLYELTYSLEMPGSINRKKFLDDLRVRNGNLAITLFESELEGGL
jgi:uncharacterized membrane protein YhiD involved in acid resistance